MVNPTLAPDQQYIIVGTSTYYVLVCRGGSRGGSLGSNEPPFLLDTIVILTYWLFVTPSSV